MLTEWKVYYTVKNTLNYIVLEMGRSVERIEHKTWHTSVNMCNQSVFVWKQLMKLNYKKNQENSDPITCGEKNHLNMQHNKSIITLQKEVGWYVQNNMSRISELKYNNIEVSSQIPTIWVRTCALTSLLRY